MGFFDSIGNVFEDIGGAIGQAGGFLGDVLTGGAISDARSVEQSNRTNVDLAREQMAFQERMSNSAYQRAMDDMAKAGLNPMLAFSQGGASSPQGALARVEPVNKEAGKFGAAAIKNTLDMLKLKADVHNVTSSARLNEQNEEVGKANIYKAEASADLDKDKAFNVVQERKNLEIQEKILKERQRSAAADADQAEYERNYKGARQKLDVKAAPFDAAAERVSQALGTVNTGKNVLRGPRKRTTKQYDVNPGSGEVYRERHTESEGN